MGQSTQLNAGSSLLGGSSSVDPSSGSPLITDDVRDAPAVLLLGSSDLDHAGASLVAAGDMNGDRLGDLAYTTRNPWRVHIITGESGYLPTAPRRTLAGAAGDTYGARLAGGADVNGDGHDDLAVVVGTPQPDGTTLWRVEVVTGASTAMIGEGRQTIAAPSLGSTFATGVALLDDVNGDGYGDLLVTAPPSAGSSVPGKAWIFAGMAGGVNTTAAWVYDGPAGTAFGAAAVAAGDVNGDGLSDFAVTTGGAAGSSGMGALYVFYGAAQWALRPASVRSGEQAEDGFAAALAAGDFNGDGYSDLAVGAPRFDISPEVPDAGKVYEYRGSAAGLATTAATTRVGDPGQRFASHVAGAGDVNGDQFADLTVGAPLASADGPLTNGQVFVYFGGTNGLSTDYDFTEAGQAGNDLYGASAAAPGDMDGDGAAELAVSAPGRDAEGHPDAGAVYLYTGARIRLPVAAISLDFPDLTDGSALARRPAAYHMLATVVYRGPLAEMDGVDVRLLLPTSGRTIDLVWSPGGSITMDTACADLVELAPDSAVAPSGSLKHGQQLSISLRFSWQVDEPAALDAQVWAADDAGTQSSLRQDAALRVISRLEFSAPLQVEGADGTAVESGGYVRSGESLHWTGGGVVYAGTHIVPASSEFYVRVAGGAAAPTRATVDPLTGSIAATRLAPEESEPLPHGIVEALSASDLVLAREEVALSVDGQPVTFGTMNPPEGSTLSESRVEVSVPLADARSGVAPASVEWSVSHSDPPVFSTWSAATTSGTSPVVAVAPVDLEEGAANYIQFRATDLVGNGPAYSQVLHLGLDYGAIEFTLVGAETPAWYRSGDVPLSFQVTSTRAVPVDLGSLQYMVSSPTAGEWVPLGLSGQSASANFQILLSLPDGRNSVTLRATLLEGGTYVSRAFVFSVDSTPPTIEVMSPAQGIWLTQQSATSRIFITDPTSGVDTASIRYRVLPPDSTQWSPWQVPTVQVAPSGVYASAIVPVLDGTDNFVEWSVYDVAGQGPVRSGYQRILVDTRPVVFGAPSPTSGSQLESVERLSIAVSDKEGSGVDLSSVEFQVRLPDGLKTEWMDAGVEGIVSEVTVAVAYALPVGTSVIEWRAHDAAGTSVVLSGPVEVTVLPPRGPDLAPRLVLRSPLADGLYLAGVDLKLDATPSFDPEGEPLTFSWWLDGERLHQRDPIVWISLEPGHHAVTVIVSDGTASAVVRTVEFDVVQPPSAPGALSSTLEQGLVFAVVALSLMALCVRVWAAHGRRALRR